jgi:hypothetical protein
VSKLEQKNKFVKRKKRHDSHFHSCSIICKYSSIIVSVRGCVSLLIKIIIRNTDTSIVRRRKAFHLSCCC